MNDLVFVMYNLKLNNNQVKKQADDFGVEDDLSSDDDWITEGEKHSNIDLLGAIDSATRRQNGNEDESDEEEIPNDAEMESHATEDDLEIQIDDIGVGTSSSTNAHNIGVGTSSETILLMLMITMNVRGIMRKIKAMKLVLVYMTPADYLF